MSIRHHSPQAGAERAATLAVNEVRYTADVDPWSQTLHLLKALCSQPLASCVDRPANGALGRPASRTSLKHEPEKARRRAEDESTRMRPAAITVLERLSETTVVLRWCSSRCHYGDQVWTRQMARASGICAVTGERIRRGDPVFRAQNRSRTPPANVAAMIHPSVIEPSLET